MSGNQNSSKIERKKISIILLLIDRVNKVSIFDETPLMSTYLLAFLISKFDNKTIFNENGTKFQAFAEPDLVIHSEFGLKTAVDALRLFQNAFETKYELPKLDQVALPVFNIGGMENHGIIFYRKDYFLYDPTVSKSITASGEIKIKIEKKTLNIQFSISNFLFTLYVLQLLPSFSSIN